MNTPDSNSLLPCPCCPTGVAKCAIVIAEPHCFIRCNACGLRTRDYGDHEIDRMRADWNRRTTIPAPAKEPTDVSKAAFHNARLPGDAFWSELMPETRAWIARLCACAIAESDKIRASAPVLPNLKLNVLTLQGMEALHRAGRTGCKLHYSDGNPSKEVTHDEAVKLMKEGFAITSDFSCHVVSVNY